MNKDVIYIDVEDDITAIIGKVKAGKEKIVALVPPKRVGVLQSAVNLRLLERAAKQEHKRLVLISNNSALVALAAAAKIPVAKNLQSKPEIAEIAVLDVDNGEDIIDGSQLPIGDHARIGDDKTTSVALGSLSIDDPLDGAKKAAPPVAGGALAKPRVKSGIKVPNFNTFRKKLIFGIGGGVLLIAFLVWATLIAPRATVIITARTTESSANNKVTFSPTLNTDAATNTLKATSMQSKKDVSVEFEATENKEVGEKAKGSVTIRNCDYRNGVTLPAGTQFTSGSITFVSTAAVSVPGYNTGALPDSACTLSGSFSGKATVAVEASAIGDSFNVSARTYTVGSIPASAKVDATGTDMAGGSKRQVKVVSSTDIQNAIDQVTKQNTDEVKKQLSDQFDKTYTVLDQTFKVDQGSLQSTPAKGQEVASGTKAKLTTSVTYSMVGVTKADIGKFLDNYFAAQLKDSQNQRTYDNGSEEATFTNVTAGNEGAFTANLVATAKTGPKINDDEIKTTAKGKRYGDVQSAIEAIQGVDNVDVKFWPFWVNGVPNDTNKIKVEFNLNESK